MTYFYENSLSRIDKTFLRSITDKKAKPYTYELKSPEMVFSRLQPNDFDQEETQNFIDSNLAFEKRVNLFVAMLPYIEQDEACKYLSALNLHEYVRIFDSHNKPKFEINQQSEIILDAFKQKGWIFEYVEDENRPGYYKIRRREPRKNEKE